MPIKHIKQEIMKLSDSIKEEQFHIINEYYGEQDLYSFSNEQVIFYCNPYSGEVWKIIECLKVIEKIKEIHITFTSKKDEDYDVIRIDLKEE